MFNLIKYFSVLRNEVNFVKLVPLRHFNVSHFKGRPLPTKAFRVSWKLPSIHEELKPKNVYNFFQRIQNIDCVTSNDVRSEEFKEFLNRAHHVITHQSSGNEMVQVLIGIINNKSLRDHEINDCVVNALISKIQDVPFNELVFLDYCIKKLKLNDFYNELRLKIQIIYLLKTHELLHNSRHFEEVKPIFSYMRNNVDIVLPEALDKLTIHLMQIDNNKFSIDDIMNVISLYSQFNHLSEQSIQTLNKMVKLWCERDPQFRDVELLLSLLAYSKKINKRALEDAGLIQFIFESIENKCKERTVGCFKRLIEMGYWQRSIDLMSQLIKRDIFQSNVHFFIELCTACEKNKYTPANWKTSIMPALETIDFRKYMTKDENFDWPRFAVQLHSLGYSDIVLIEALLKSPKFFNSPFVEKLEDILKESRGFVAERAAFAKFKKSHRIISRLPSKGEDVDPKDVIEFFRGLSEIKNVGADDVQKPEFQSLLSRTMEIIHQMAGSEILTVMIGTIHHEQLRKHPINNCAMNALIPKIRDLDFKGVAFLDYLIQRRKFNSSYKRLRSEIQKTFLENVDRILEECNEFDNLLPTMIYMSKNANIVSARVLSSFSKLLMMADGHYKIDDITNILILFSQFNNLEQQAIEALNKMVKMWCERNPKLRDVELLVSLLDHSENPDKMDKRAFENSGLIRFIFDFLNESYHPKTFYCFINLIRMGYWREGIESMSKCFEKGIVNSKDASAYFTLCISCGKYKFKPPNWQSIILPMLKSFDFRPHIVRHEKFNWPLFALQLHLLGYNDFGLIEALITSGKWKNSRHLEKLNNILMEETPDEVYPSNSCFNSQSNLQLMSTFLSEKSLQQSLEGIIGKEFILCDYEVSENFKVPFIIKVDFNEAKFIPINKSNITEILKANEKLIGIFVVDDEDKWMQLKELLQMVDIGEMDLKFTKIIPDKWLSKQMVVEPNDFRRDVLLQQMIDFLRKKVKKNYSHS